MSFNPLWVVSAVLILFGISSLAPPAIQLTGILLGRLTAWREREGAPEVSSNSDAPAPPGFAAHLAVIREASKSASPEVRESYYFQSMTKAEVLAAEVERLSP